MIWTLDSNRKLFFNYWQCKNFFKSNWCFKFKFQKKILQFLSWDWYIRKIIYKCNLNFLKWEFLKISTLLHQIILHWGWLKFFYDYLATRFSFTFINFLNKFFKRISSCLAKSGFIEFKWTKKYDYFAQFIEHKSKRKQVQQNYHSITK